MGIKETHSTLKTLLETSLISTSLLLAVPPSIEKEDVEDTVKVPEGEMAHLMCNVSGKGHTVDWRRVKRQL